MITVNLNRLNFKAGYKVLDVGCGSGRHMAAIYDFNKDIKLIGSDLSFDDLKSTRKRMQLHKKLLNHNYGQWEVISSDITRLPFKDQCFDIIICSEVLEHIDNDEKAINELVRVLKPNRTLVISVPRYFVEKACWRLSTEYANADHVRIYRKTELINLLKAFNLSCYYSHYSHSIHTPFWLLKCILGLTVTNSVLLRLYHDFLLWDIMKRPHIIRFLDRLLNPLFGKSLVLYTTKK